MATRLPGETVGDQTKTIRTQGETREAESTMHSCLLPLRGPEEAPVFQWLETRAQVWGSRSVGTPCLCAPLHGPIFHCRGPARAQFIMATFRNHPRKCRFPLGRAQVP